MRKTTEKLALKAVKECNSDGLNFKELCAEDQHLLLKWFETFRRLAVENERESAEPFCYFASDAEGDIEYNKTDRFSYGRSGGNPLFTFPPAAIDRDSVIEECAKVCAGIGQDWPAMSDTPHPEYIAKKLRALKSQPAAPDPRDEVIRLSRETLAGIVSADYRKWEELANAEEFVRWAKSKANHTLAAIDKVMKEGK